MKFGWIRQLPDLDYGLDHPQIAPVFQKLSAAGAGLGRETNNRKFCAPVLDQGNTGSCTAFSMLNIFRFLDMKYKGKTIDYSALFTYWNSRKSLAYKARMEDEGATIRATFKECIALGIPPEDVWPFDEEMVNKEPPARAYGYAQNFQSLKFARQRNLNEIRAVLRAGFPVNIGFMCFKKALDLAEKDGIVRYPQSGDRPVGGHAIAIIDDLLGHELLLFQNSWGPGWGEKGFGFLDYKYFTSDPPLADDFMALFSKEWLDLEPLK